MKRTTQTVLVDGIIYGVLILVFGGFFLPIAVGGNMGLLVILGFFGAGIILRFIEATIDNFSGDRQ